MAAGPQILAEDNGVAMPEDAVEMDEYKLEFDSAGEAIADISLARPAYWYFSTPMAIAMTY